MGIELGADFNNTWTCYQGDKLACGVCSACSLRLKGFIEAGYIDPIQYLNQDKLNTIYKANNCSYCLS